MFIRELTINFFLLFYPEIQTVVITIPNILSKQADVCTQRKPS